jgi:hypothetical protein
LAGVGALTGSSAAAEAPGDAVTVTAGALLGAGGTLATDSGAFDAARASAGAGPEASGVGALGARAAGAAQPVSPADGGAPPTINTDTANAHGYVRRNERRVTGPGGVSIGAEVGPNPEPRYVLRACIGRRVGTIVRPAMAPRPALASTEPRLLRRPARRLPWAIAIGLTAGLTTRQAAAEPPASSETSEAGPRAAALPSLSLDQYPPPSARRNLLIAGGVTVAAWYSLALGSSYIWPDTVGAKDLRIPVAGPWIAFAHSGCGPVASCSKTIVVIRAIATLLDGIGQASGVAFVGEGLFLPTQEPKRVPAEAAETSEAPRLELHPTFDAGKNTVGFGVLGVF